MELKRDKLIMMWYFVQEVSEAAAEALVNLSQNLNLAAEMVQMRLIDTAMDVLYKPDCSVTPLLVMLLVNLTQLDAGIASLLQVGFHLFICKQFGIYVMRSTCNDHVMMSQAAKRV